MLKAECLHLPSKKVLLQTETELWGYPVAQQNMKSSGLNKHKIRYSGKKKKHIIKTQLIVGVHTERIIVLRSKR